ncbi:MAG: tocopherol cyclase family protein [Anaerolineae bacterium]
MYRYLYETLHPEIYHGFRKRPPYFEGWYFKLVSADEQTRYAVIPGVFRALNPQEDHAFVQVLNGMTGKATYHRYPVEAFRASEEAFDVWVGPNHFHQDGLSLNIDDEQLSISGELHFSGGEGWPVTVTSPGVMGWYAWLPIMETYHGILSFDHIISGSLQIDQTPVRFDNGRGYLEKDWGQAFPSGYIWQQSNHFDTPSTCLTASIAVIPSLGRTFAGFLVGFYHHRKLYRLTTYTGAKVEKLNITDDRVFWTVRDRQYRLEMTAERAEGGLLMAPIRTEMHKRVDETMKSSIHVRFTHHTSGEIIFEGTGRAAGLEVHGDLDTLLSMV